MIIREITVRTEETAEITDPTVESTDLTTDITALIIIIEMMEAIMATMEMDKVVTGVVTAASEMDMATMEMVEAATDTDMAKMVTDEEGERSSNSLGRNIEGQKRLMYNLGFRPDFTSQLTQINKCMIVRRNVQFGCSECYSRDRVKT